MSYFLVKACSYCGAFFTEWHECAGTERARFQSSLAGKETDDQKMVERLQELIERHKEQP